MNDQYKNSYKATAKELVSLSVYNVGYQLCDAGYQWGPGIRDHYLIHYVISGKGTYEVNNETHFLSAEDAFLVYFTSALISSSVSFTSMLVASIPIWILPNGV